MAQSNKFEDLTPSYDVDLGLYKEALDEAFNNKKVKNIAITGSYGSGKSSLIETYKKEKKLNVMHISLSHFEGDNSIDPDKIINVLEGKIINQLVQQIDSDTIPQTRFMIKKEVDKNKVIKYVGFIFTAAICLVINIYFENWKYLIVGLSKEFGLSFLLCLCSPFFQIITFVCFFVILVYIIYNIVLIQQDKQLIKKAVVKDFEIEVFEENNDSFFDKYLNEVLYIFRKSKIDIFVFEDMDRYNNNLIFEKLREINTLINSKLDGDRIVRFVYLLRDDIFTSKDRTKFFDFIIPVIPVVDSSNSYNKLKERFQKNGILNQFDQNFLSDISLYIDEYRILKNICNEYLIYDSKLNFIDLDPNKLFAMIVYKNIFPKDFSMLQMNLGYVKEIFNRKQEIAESHKNKLEKEIEDLNQEIDYINNIFQDNIDELDAMFFVHPDNLRVGSTKLENISNGVELIKMIKGNDYDADKYNTNGFFMGEKNLKNDFEKLLEIPEYKKIFDILTKGKGNEIQRINKEILSKRNEIDQIKRKSLSELINRDNKEEVFSNREDDKSEQYLYIKESSYFDLLKYLIRNGYIDENTYFDYMSYFYPNGISQNDKIFLRSITDQKALGYDYRLDSPIKVYKRINEKYYLDPEVLNNNLLSYLLSTDKKDELLKINQLLKTNNNLDFITQYFDTYINVDRFSFYFLNDSEVIKKIVLKEGINTVEMIKYALSFNDLKLDENTIEFINNHSEIVGSSKIVYDKYSYIEHVDNTKDEISKERFEENIVDKVANNFKNNGIEFKHIDFQNVDLAFLEVIYENNCYTISFDHVKQMMEYFYNLPSNCDYYSKNATLVFSDKEQPLYQYIIENPNTYLKMTLNSSNNKINDDEGVVIEILNMDNLENDLKESYIERLDTKVTNISSVNSELWDGLLINRKVNETEDNIICYFNKYQELNDVLIGFMNLFEKEIILDFDNIDNKYGDEFRSEFFDEIVGCNKLENKQYNSIFKNCNERHYKNFYIENLNEDKVDILIKCKVVRMNSETLTFMRKEYSSNIENYLDNYSNDYCDLIIDNSQLFDYDELLYVLESKQFSVLQKISLMECTSRTIDYNPNYLEKVKINILDSHLNEDDYQLVSDNFNNETDDVKNKITKVFDNDLSTVISKSISLNQELLFNLFGENEINENEKLLLINNSIERYDFESIRKCFEYIKDEDFIYIFKGKNPKITINDTNKSILHILKSKEIVSSFKEENDYYRVYIKHRK
ncbi:MAG: hypothetical protein V8R58_04040 [Faecalibacillus faecis]|nr:Uncharacterised protein [uncultured Clostridium sp.]HJI35319.1 hypothetical protein [Coprobacillaceae bacterium]